MFSNEEIIKSAMSQNLNGLEIVPVKKDRTVEYSQINDKRKSRRIPKDVAKWSTGNFVSYAKKLYFVRYNKSWVLNYPSACLESLKVRDQLMLMNNGSCDNELFHEYITWYFEYIIDDILTKTNDFYFRSLAQDWVIQRFLEQRSSDDQPQEVVKKKEVPQVSFDLERIEALYLLSEEKLLESYGFVVVVNWLIVYKNMSLKEALVLVYNVAKSSKNLDDIINKTEELGPYPKDCVFKEPNKLLQKINPERKLKTRFAQNHAAGLEFLVKK